MKTMTTRTTAAILFSLCAAAGAQQAPTVTLGRVLQEQIVPTPGKPGETSRSFKPLPEGAYRFELGEYSSGASGLVLKLPQLRDEKVVSVREAVVIRRPDGDPETSHVLFVPDPEGIAMDPLGPVSIVVVTRLRADLPHDRESVLKAWEPRTPEQRKAMEARGVEFHRIKTGLGEGLERIVPNRVADVNFPYRTHTNEQAKQVRSVGVTRYLVSQDKALLEFSQVFPCRELVGDACKEAALRASDRFVQGVSSFVLFSNPSKPQGAASQPQNAASRPRGK
jgi:hypothetical protein